MLCNYNINVHHIGYAVKDIEKAEEAFSLLGYKRVNLSDDIVGYDCVYGGGGGNIQKTELDIINDFDRNVRILMLKNKSILVELVSFLDKTKKSPIDFLFKSDSIFPGNGIPYHICYIVNNMKESIDQLRKNRFIVIQPPNKAIALNNKYVSFLFHKDIGIIELYEK
jgi:methylmalonyl-CoA/ethylmalonyl-CoA epimerase